MPFLPSFGSRRTGPELKRAPLGWSGGSTYGSVASKSTPYQQSWDAQRATKAGMEMTTWVFRAVDAIASNQAGLPFIVRRGDARTGDIIKNHDLLPFFNKKANPYTNSWSFRYRLSCLVLLDKNGVFVQVQKSRRGKIIGLYILAPGTCRPIPDPKTYISGFEVTIGSDKEYLPPDEVVWITLPHPTEPYQSMTPLEALGLTIETDILAKMFNRNFLQNDGRPGGILAIKGGMEDEDAEILRNRFLGPAAGGNGVRGAGRLTVLETGDGGVDFVDTATSPRDAQWVDGRKQTKEEIFIGFGVPETITGNASGRTFDNASVETEIFWRETMLPHFQLLARPLDVLTLEDDEYAAFDTSGVYVLDRDKREQSKYYLEEFKAGLISVDTYLEKTGQAKIGDDHRYIMNNLAQYEPDGTLTVNWDEETGMPKLPAPPISPAGPSGPQATGGGGNPPGSPADSQDNPTAPTGRGETPSTATTPSTRALQPPPPMELLPAMEIRGIQWGRWEVEPFAMKAWTRTLGGRFSSWERHVKSQMQAFFERQQRVVMTRMRSEKSRLLWESGKLTVEDLFDRKRWDDELSSDSEGWIANVMADFGSDVVHAFKTEWVSAHSQPSVAYQAKRIAKVNAETMGLIAKVLVRSRSNNLDMEMVAAYVEKVFTEAKGSRSMGIASTEVVAAANTGIFVGAGISGRNDLVKTWTALDDEHSSLDGETVLFSEKFTVKSHLLDYPGDPVGDPSVTVGCRCLLTIGTPAGPIGIDTIKSLHQRVHEVDPF